MNKDGPTHIVSCVEAGVDFSFRTAFRESWGLVNLLQIAGRAAPAGISDGKSQMADWLCRIIDAATQTVVVEPGLIQRLENPDRSQWPGWRELMLGSVQLWIGKEREFALPELRGLPGVFRWNLQYDSFLGYMAGVMPLLKAGKSGFEPL